MNERTYEEDHGVSGLPIDDCGGENEDPETDILAMIHELETDKQVYLDIIHAWDQLDKAREKLESIHPNRGFVMGITVNRVNISRDEAEGAIQSKLVSIKRLHNDLAEIQKEGCQ